MKKILFAIIICLFFIVPAASQFNGCPFGFCSPPTVASSCSQATAFLARNGNANSSATTAFICGGVSDGWWSKWDVLYIHATDTSAHALLNWTSSGFTGALIATALTFTANQGFTGNASGAIDTGFILAVNGVNYALNSASGFVCILNNRTTRGNLVSFGAQDNTSTSYSLLVPFDTLGTRGDLNGPTGAAVAGAAGTQGSWLLNRTSNTNVDVYFGPGSTKLGSITTPSTSVTVVNSIYELAFNTGAVAGIQNPTTDQQAAFGLGGSFTGTDWANFQARLHAYMVAVNGSGC